MLVVVCCYFKVWAIISCCFMLQCNAISCTCVSDDKRWLATADIGDDCMLIVWDTQTR